MANIVEEWDSSHEHWKRARLGGVGHVAAALATWLRRWSLLH